MIDKIWNIYCIITTTIVISVGAISFIGVLAIIISSLYEMVVDIAKEVLNID